MWINDKMFPVGFVSAIKKVDAQSYICEHSMERVFNVHPPHACAHQMACPVHRRTAHPVRDWKQTWTDLPGRRGRRFMRRVCTHGRWVVDPDEPFKPSYEEQMRLGMQDCPKCNPAFRTVLEQDLQVVKENIGIVSLFLMRGDFGRVVTIVERVPNGQEHELEFYPDEALLYLGFCQSELEEELG